MSETVGPAPSAKWPGRTPSWCSADVKWGRRILRRYSGTYSNCSAIRLLWLTWCISETAGPAPSAKWPDRTPSWCSANVKWGRRILRRYSGTYSKCSAIRLLWLTLCMSKSRDLPRFKVIKPYAPLRSTYVKWGRRILRRYSGTYSKCSAIRL